jgi:uncharacterized protein
MWKKDLFFVVAAATIIFVMAYAVYRLVDPLPPRHVVIAAGPAGSIYDSYARHYARILARQAKSP